MSCMAAATSMLRESRSMGGLRPSALRDILAGVISLSMDEMGHGGWKRDLVCYKEGLREIGE